MLTAGVGAAATGISVLTKNSVDAFASYEQLTGGVETLFKTASDQVMQYANNAYQTAGLSANAYMDTVTSFSASLISSLDGDTTAAAEKANTAITDMSDNANKMGTSMEMIQNAYQGFAKQNYTMLDNLKLGYGGTKEEMERLLADAEKLSGVHYDISSFADITDAIHVIQTEMHISGITADEAAEAVKNGTMTQEEAFEAMGTTAKEAATTVEGSINMTKAAWENLVTGLGDSNSDIETLVDNFTTSTETMLSNLIPVLETILPKLSEGITKIAANLLPEIPPIIEGLLPALVDGAVSLINSLVAVLPSLMTAITSALPSVITGIATIVVEAIPALISGITECIPILVEALSGIMLQLAESLPEQLPIFIEQMLTLIQDLASTIAENAPILIDAGIQMILALAEGIIQSLPTIIEMLPTIITTIANVINDNMPTILKAGVTILVMLIKGIIQSIPLIIENIPKIIEAIVAVWSAFNWLQLGKKAMDLLKDGIVGMLSALKGTGKLVVDAVGNAIKSLPHTLMSIGKNGIQGLINGLEGMLARLLNTIGTILIYMVQAFGKVSLKDVGKHIIQGLIDGIAGMAGTLLKCVGDVMGNVLDKVKSIFGIHSPSKEFKWIGQMCVAGLDEPLEEYNPYDTVSKSFKANPYTLASNFAGTSRAIYTAQASMDYGRMAGAMVTAFERAGFKVEIGRREFGRIVREVMA